jgi:hypothetical protein
MSKDLFEMQDQTYHRDSECGLMEEATENRRLLLG